MSDSSGLWGAVKQFRWWCDGWKQCTAMMSSYTYTYIVEKCLTCPFDSIGITRLIVYGCLDLLIVRFGETDFKAKSKTLTS